MFGFNKKKNLIFAATLVILLVVISLFLSFIKLPILNTLKGPLNLLMLFKREVNGLIFYHRNLVQNEKLKKEVALLKQKLNETREANLENTRLNRLLELKQKIPYKVIAAKVIGRNPDNWSSSIILNKGGSDGVRRGFVVIGYLGLLGRIVETTSSTSKVMLINDSNSSVSALIQRSRQEGLVSGTLSHSLIMRYLPKEADIKVSDVVITSGLTEVYPKGLLIGEIISVGEEFSGLTHYALIEPYANLSDIEEVLIICR